MEWYWWLLTSVIFSCMLIVTVGVLGLFHRPDFDIDESEEFSGVIDVKRNNSLCDANRVREQFDSDGG
jgi:hypothetical protein